MITLDTTSLDSGKDEIYSVERGSKVKVFLNGDELRGCIYCNVSKGVAICVKRDLRGQMMIAQDEIVHELIFGDITVEQIGGSNDEAGKRIGGGWTGPVTKDDISRIKGK